jgi:hypothetical protein
MSLFELIPLGFLMVALRHVPRKAKSIVFNAYMALPSSESDMQTMMHEENAAAWSDACRSISSSQPLLPTSNLL